MESLFLEESQYSHKVYLFDLYVNHQLLIIYCLICRSRDAIFRVVSKLTQKAENFYKNQSKRAGDKEWIDNELNKGNFLKICDISETQSTSTPTKVLGQSTPTKDLAELALSPKRKIENEERGRGKRIKFQKSCCDLDCCLPVRRALFVNDMEIQKCIFGYIRILLYFRNDDLD